MRVREWEPRRKLVLQASPQEDHRVPGCGAGCVMGLLAPAALAAGLPLALGKPIPAIFLFAWGLASLFVGGLASAVLSSMSWGRRFVADPSGLAWTEQLASGKLRETRHARDTIRAFTVQPPYEPDERGSVRVQLELLAGKAEDAPFVDLPVDFLSTPEETLELGFRIASTLGLARYERVEREEKEKGLPVKRTVFTFRPDAPLEVPDVAGPPDFGKGRFEEASRRSDWGLALASPSWTEKMGVRESTPSRLHLLPGSRATFLYFLLPPLALGVLAWLLTLSGRVSSWILVPAAIVLSTLAGGLTFLLVAWARQPRRPIVLAEGRLSVGGRAPYALPLETLRRVVLVQDKDKDVDVLLDCDEGLLEIQSGGVKNDERLAAMALANDLATRLRVPCVFYRPREERPGPAAGDTAS